MKLHDTSAIRDEPEYWSSLTGRVVTAARGHQYSILGWLSGSRGISVAAAALVLAAILSWRGGGAASVPTILNTPAAPSVGALLFSTAR